MSHTALAVLMQFYSLSDFAESFSSLNSVTGSLFLGKDITVEFYKGISLLLPTTQQPISPKTHQ